MSFYFLKSTFVRIVISWILTMMALTILSIILCANNNRLANQVSNLQVEEEQNNAMIQQYQQLLKRKQQLIYFINKGKEIKKSQEKQNNFFKNLIWLQNKYVIINHMLYENGKIVLSLQGKNHFLVSQFNIDTKNVDLMKNMKMSDVDIQYNNKNNQMVFFSLSGEID
jgi:hypothetical protein